MDVSVILEHLNENGYRATAMVPMPLVAEAPTRKEAVEKIQSLVREKLARVEVIQVAVPSSTEPNPWLAIAGTWQNHPDVDAVMGNIEAYRREIDADPSRI